MDSCRLSHVCHSFVTAVPAHLLDPIIRSRRSGAILPGHTAAARLGEVPMHSYPPRALCVALQFLLLGAVVVTSSTNSPGLKDRQLKDPVSEPAPGAVMIQPAQSRRGRQLPALRRGRRSEADLLVHGVASAICMPAPGGRRRDNFNRIAGQRQGQGCSGPEPLNTIRRDGKHPPADLEAELKDTFTVLQVWAG